uniref:Gag1-like clamp domain-containing protein n=1 Tax=Manihot esculenta TaxID=3983 RepID=A0A2C9W528_MANES
MESFKNRCKSVFSVRKSFLNQTERCFENKPCCSFVLFCGACFQAFLFVTMESFKSKCNALFSSRGCFGCCAKLSTLLTVDDPSKGLASQGRTVKRASTVDDIWSTSAGEMDLSGEQSQRSFSSIMTLNQPFHPYTNDGSTSNSFEFLNPGLLLWKQTRQQWLANKRSPNNTQVQEPTIRGNATYESLVGTNKPFPRRIPLTEMVDFLVDIWEHEGLHD